MKAQKGQFMQTYHYDATTQYKERIQAYERLLKEALTILHEGAGSADSVRMSKNAVHAALKELGKIGSLPKNKKEAA